MWSTANEVPLTLGERLVLIARMAVADHARQRGQASDPCDRRTPGNAATAAVVGGDREDLDTAGEHETRFEDSYWGRTAEPPVPTECGAEADTPGR